MDSEEDIRARPLGAERHGGGLGMRMELILSFCGSLSLSLSLSLFHVSSLSLSLTPLIARRSARVNFGCHVGACDGVAVVVAKQTDCNKEALQKCRFFGCGHWQPTADSCLRRRRRTTTTRLLVCYNRFQRQ